MTGFRSPSDMFFGIQTSKKTNKLMRLDPYLSTCGDFLSCDSLHKQGKEAISN